MLHLADLTNRKLFASHEALERRSADICAGIPRSSYILPRHVSNVYVARKMYCSSYLLVLCSVCFVLVHSFDIYESNRKSFYDHSVHDIEGNEVSLEKYKGKVCMPFY